MYFRVFAAMKEIAANPNIASEQICCCMIQLAHDLHRYDMYTRRAAAILENAVDLYGTAIAHQCEIRYALNDPDKQINDIINRTLSDCFMILLSLVVVSAYFYSSRWDDFCYYLPVVLGICFFCFLFAYAAHQENAETLLEQCKQLNTLINPNSVTTADKKKNKNSLVDYPDELRIECARYYCSKGCHTCDVTEFVQKVVLNSGGKHYVVADDPINARHKLLPCGDIHQNVYKNFTIAYRPPKSDTLMVKTYNEVEPIKIP